MNDNEKKQVILDVDETVYLSGLSLDGITIYRGGRKVYPEPGAVLVMRPRLIDRETAVGKRL